MNVRVSLRLKHPYPPPALGPVASPTPYNYADPNPNPNPNRNADKVISNCTVAERELFRQGVKALQHEARGSDYDYQAEPNLNPPTLAGGEGPPTRSPWP